MDKNVLAPILAGIGLGWLAFHPEGQKMAKGLGQSVLPALSGGKPDEGSPEKEGEKNKDDSPSRHKAGDKAEDKNED